MPKLALTLALLWALSPCAGLAAPPPTDLTPSVGAPTRLADGGQGAISPDGRWIVYRQGPEGRGEIILQGLDDGAPRALTHNDFEDTDPTFSREGDQIIWAAKPGARYQLFTQPIAGGAPRPLTDGATNARHPHVSPLRYTFSAVIDDECGGPQARIEGTYEKVVYTRQEGADEAIWFVSLDGAHQGRVSPEGARCQRPYFSGDGLSLAFTCDGAALDTQARWDMTLGEALATLQGEAAGCDSEATADDPCLKALPRRYTRHVAQGPPAAGVVAAGYSHNQIWRLGARGDEILSQLRVGEPPWRPLARGRSPRWSPDGRRLLFDAPEGLSWAPTRGYLQRVNNLHDYPELWTKGASARLAQNRFVARPGQEKELFAFYEKVRYARRGPFITADAALQIFHDELSRLLKDSEHKAMARLTRFSRRQLARFSDQLDAPTGRYLAELYATALIFLEAAAEHKAPELEPGPPPDEDEHERLPSPMEVIAAGIEPRIKALPVGIQANVRARAAAILSHEGVSTLMVPEIGEVLVDDSMFQVRGHYRASALAGYFIAMQHFAAMPIPLDGVGLGALRFDKAAHEDWAAVEGLSAAFLGRPIEPTPGHIRALRRTKPMLFQPGRGEALARALREAVGPIPLRGLEGAIKGEPVARVKLFPKRFGLDSAFFSALTSPTLKVEGRCPRRWPLVEEVFAALGAPRAQAIVNELISAEAAEGGCDELAWLGHYKAALDELIRAHGGGIEAVDLYHGVLALLRTLAIHAGEGARLEFTQSAAWGDRALLSALAGYTQLKHDAVLYAAQEYGVECGGGAAIKLFIEQPQLPTPKGFVDPMPRFFRQLEALAEILYQRLGGGQEPKLQQQWGEDALLMNAKRFAGRLAAMAEQEIKGVALTEADQRWIFKVGALMEALLIGQEETQDTYYGGDEGRLERGVTLVTDIYTQLTLAEVLQVGIGRLLNLFVIVPDGPSEALTQGALHSYRAFKQPMSARMTDEAFWETLKDSAGPPLPAWTRSFIEDQP
ncbi:DUF3160 domain-containing protein [Myxococcota bacterium]|nr:DUF3160 domain-containing protein [Myxococcota bacterium]